MQSEFLKSTFPDPEAIRMAQLADPLCAGLLTSLVTGTVPESDLSKEIRRCLTTAVLHEGLLHRQVEYLRPSSPTTMGTRLLAVRRHSRLPRPVQPPRTRSDIPSHEARRLLAEDVRRRRRPRATLPPLLFAKRPNRRQGRGHTPDVGTYPFDCLVCDILDMSSHLGKTLAGNTKLVVFADSLSRWVEAIPVSGDPTSEEILDIFITHIFSRYGLPRTVRSDGGSNLTSMLIKAVYDASQDRAGGGHGPSPQLSWSRRTFQRHPLRNGARVHRQGHCVG